MSIVETCYRRLSSTTVGTQSVINWTVVGWQYLRAPTLDHCSLYQVIVKLCLRHDTVACVNLRKLITRFDDRYAVANFLSLEFGAKFQGKYSYFWRYLNFPIKHCRVGRKKLPFQNPARFVHPFRWYTLSFQRLWSYDLMALYKYVHYYYFFTQVV